ncbi:MAG: TetR family transcriptional regulator [Nitriliruptorales bacterium]|nr:TetR family transcriptional regulator [Nitriliruptorales bacterium]
MAISHSETGSASADRRSRRREQTITEALDHAGDIMAEQGVGGLTISQMARRMGVKPPSLYKYFPSLHAVYDALFARGLAGVDAVVADVVASAPAGLPRIEAGVEAVVRWCIEHPALAQLLYWRPVPGFEPSSGTFSASVRSTEQLRDELREAVRLGQLDPRADSDEAARLLTILISGLITQQMANEPGAGYDSGRFTTLTRQAQNMFRCYYQPASDS